MDFLFNGQRVFESTGMRSKTKAQDVYERRKQELKDGTAGIKKRKQPLLLSVAAKTWQVEKGLRWSPKMRLIAKHALDHLLPVLGKRLLVDIDSADIRDYRDKRWADASPRTVNIEVGALRQIMKKYGSWERVKASDEWKDVGMLEERADAGRAIPVAEESMLILECGRSVSRSSLALCPTPTRNRSAFQHYPHVDVGTG